MDKKELSGFIRFVEAALIKGTKKGVILLKLIQKAYPNWTASSLEEEKIIERLFPGDQSNNNLKRLRSELLSLLKEYFIFLELQSDPRRKELMWLNTLLKREQYGHFKKDWIKVKNKLSRSPVRSAEHFYYQYQLEDVYRKYIDVNRTDKDQISFQSFFDHFECYTIIEKLRYCCYAMLVENVQDSQHQVFMLPELEKHLKESEWLQKNQVINIYYTLFRVFREKNTSLLFSGLEPLLSTYNMLFTEEELKDINNLVPAYLINRINNGQSGYLEKLFQWNQAIIDNRSAFEGPYIPHQRFKNMVSCALLLKKYEWIKWFMEKHIRHTKPSVREGLRCFIEGTVHYYQNNFREAISVLQVKVIPNNDFYFYDINSLLLRAYYELDDLESFRAIFARLKKKISRDRRTALGHQAAYQNFSELLSELIKLREKLWLSGRMKKEQLNHFYEKVSSVEPMLHKQWLLDKITVLMKE
ncbi:MAG: hypothetical protein KDC75_04815 [Phaeodactylibacter sp.]|nr:hypothetical protein [Phaeodactylibacter sp.]